LEGTGKSVVTKPLSATADCWCDHDKEVTIFDNVFKSGIKENREWKLISRGETKAGMVVWQEVEGGAEEEKHGEPPCQPTASFRHFRP